MNPVGLKEIESSHILGSWRVQSRIYSQSDRNSPLALATEHNFRREGVYRLYIKGDKFGGWDLTMESGVIENPMLTLTVDGSETQAIITRLLYSDNTRHAQLTIYLSTGLELVLLKN